MNPYPIFIEIEMQKFYKTLSEKDKRRYAAVEALKLNQGGITYIAELFECSRQTITDGIKELNQLTSGVL